MKQNSEVNFEQRGKRLEDHVDCPIHGECKCCCPCNKTKLAWAVHFAAIALLVVSCLLCAGHVWAQPITTINYDITTIERRGLQDINKKRDVISDIQGPSGSVALLLRKLKYNVPIALNCPNRPAEDTLPRRLNNGDDVAGSCTLDGTKLSGFIRDKLGSFEFIDFPGSNWTDLFALSDNGHACGMYLNPEGNGIFGFDRWHGFCKWRDGSFRTIDFPLANSVSVILGVNKDRVAVGAYFTHDPITNEASEWTPFIWSNGIFIPLNFPNGGSWTYPLKLNNDGSVLLIFDDSPAGFQGGPSEPFGGIGIFEDGHFFRVGLPSTLNGIPTSFDINGWNEDGDLAGEWRQTVCNPPGSFNCVTTRKGFIASPK